MRDIPDLKLADFGLRWRASRIHRMEVEKIPNFMKNFQQNLDTAKGKDFRKFLVKDGGIHVFDSQ